MTTEQLLSSLHALAQQQTMPQPKTRRKSKK